MFADLCKAVSDAMDKAVERGEDFDAFVYADMYEDMAKAAAAVFDANVKGQQFAEANRV